MTTGRTTAPRRVWVPLRIRDGSNEWQELWAVLDTGFTGALALPEEYTQQLRLTMNQRSTVSSATQRSVSILSGNARIMWDGRRRSVQVLQAGTHPLLGMALLWNHRITIDAVPNGPVTITPLGG